MLKTCKKCFGEGEIPVMDIKVKYPVCNRLGKVDVPEGMEICDNCKGSGGSHSPLVKNLCLVCGGSGFVPAKED